MVVDLFLAGLHQLFGFFVMLLRFGEAAAVFYCGCVILFLLFLKLAAGLRNSISAGACLFDLFHILV